MRIVVVNQHVEDVIGGSEIQCDLIARYLTQFGHDVMYAAMSPRKQSYDASYPVVPLEKPSWRSLLTVIREFRPDIIYWRYNKHQFLASAIVARMYRVTIVFGVSHIRDTKMFHLDNTSHRGRGRLRPQFIRFYKALIGAINYLGFYLVNAVTLLNADLFGKVPVKHQVVIRNSMSPQVTAFDWHKPFVLWVASLKPRKNPDIYIKLATLFPDLDFLMAGPVQNQGYAFVNDCTQLPRNVHYLGVVPPDLVNGILRSHHCICLVHTCDPEGFGNIFIQAWLQSKPTLTLYFDPEGIIENKGIGYLAGTFENLVNKLQILVDDPGLRKKMGQRAYEFASQHFRPEINIREIEKLFSEVANT